VRVVGDLLQIDPIKLNDFCNYHCLFIDQYGEKELFFKFDQSFFYDNNSHVYSTKSSTKTASTQNHEIKLVKLNDLVIESEFLPNSNNIKIKCKTKLGKILKFKLLFPKHKLILRNFKFVKMMLI
jgi:hypothetical protein